MEVAFLVFGRWLLTRRILSYSIADFEVIVLCRELIYMDTFVGLGFVSETPEQTDEHV